MNAPSLTSRAGRVLAEFDAFDKARCKYRYADMESHRAALAGACARIDADTFADGRPMPALWRAAHADFSALAALAAGDPAMTPWIYRALGARHALKLSLEAEAAGRVRADTRAPRAAPAPEQAALDFKSRAAGED